MSKSLNLIAVSAPAELERFLRHGVVPDDVEDTGGSRTPLGAYISTRCGVEGFRGIGLALDARAIAGSRPRLS